MRISSVLGLALAAYSAQAQSTPNITAALNSTSDLSILNGLVGQFPDLVSTLANASNITVFAPSNAALERIANNSAYRALASQPALVEAFLTYHVLNKTVYASDITTTPAFVHTLLNNQSLANVTGGQVVGVKRMGDTVMVMSGLGFDANVTQANVNITNGVVHIIDNILFPPANVSTTGIAAGLSALVGAVEATNLTDFVDTTKDLTIFAPTNEAFGDIASVLANLTAEQAAGVLKYHVINGTVAYSSLLSNTSLNTTSGQTLNITILDGAVFVNSARVIAADVLVANGVVHVIDSVLNPNSTLKPDPSEKGGVPAYSGASSGAVPYTSGIPTPTGSAIVTSASAVASGYTSVSSGALASASSSLAAESSSTSAGAAPKVTGAMGAAALLGGAAWLAQW